MVISRCEKCNKLMIVFSNQKFCNKCRKEIQKGAPTKELKQDKKKLRRVREYIRKISFKKIRLKGRKK